MTLIDTPNFSKVEQKSLDIFSTTFGSEVTSYKMLKRTSKSYLFELTLADGKKAERLVAATQDELPDNIDLSDFDSYFDKSPIADPTKSIQIIHFDKDYNYLTNKCYGFNPQLIQPFQNS